MRISISIIFQALALIAQDVLAFEARENADNSNQHLTPQAPVTESQTPIQ